MRWRAAVGIAIAVMAAAGSLARAEEPVAEAPVAEAPVAELVAAPPPTPPAPPAPPTPPVAAPSPPTPPPLAVVATDPRPWFFGASVGQLATKRVLDITTKARGPLYVLEGGKLLTRWLAASLVVRFDYHGMKPAPSPPFLVEVTPFQARSLAFGPRLSFAPGGGRVRLGLDVGKLLFTRIDPGFRGTAGDTVRSLTTLTELHAAFVPLRVGSINLEVGGVLGRANASEFERTSWYGGTVGLRWHTTRAANPPARLEPPRPPRPARWHLAASAGILGIKAPGSKNSNNGTQFAIVELAARLPLRKRYELALALRHGRQVLESNPLDGSDGFGGFSIATEQLSATLRYWLAPARPSRYFVGVGLGAARAVRLLGIEDDEEIRPLLLVAAGVERRAGPFMLHAELDTGYLGPSTVSHTLEYVEYSPTPREPIRHAMNLLHASLTAGVSYAF